MYQAIGILILAIFAVTPCRSASVWFDDFESYPAGGKPTNQSTWFISGGAGSTVLVSTNCSYDWRSSVQLKPTTNSVQLISTGTARASIWRTCSNGSPTLERISWSCLTTNTGIDAMYLQVRDGSSNLFCGVGLASSGKFQYKGKNGNWVDTGIPYETNVWHRLTLTLNYANATFSFFEKNNPLALNQPFATNQTVSFIPASVYVQGPVNNSGSCYVDSIKAEFLQDGSALQSLINGNLNTGRYDLASNCTYDLNYPLMLPSNFTLNGNGSTLRMAPYSQLPLLVNSNWSADNNITVSNLLLDGNAYDQLINPANNATTRYLANNLTKLDNQGIYFKEVDGLLISDVTFVDIPNEAIMLVSDSAATIVDCWFTNCALLTVSNNMSQAAVYTRWTTNSFMLNNRFFNCYEGGIANGTGSDYNFLAGNYTTNSAGGEGIFLGQSSYCVAVGNTILNSSFLGDPLNYPTNNQKYWGSGAGIACDGIGQAITQISNIICYNFIWNIGSAGITSASAVGTQIFGNVIYTADMLNQANPPGAISLYASTNVSVYGNIIQSNNCSAVGVVTSKSCTITNNLFGPDNDLNAIYLSGSSNINTNDNKYETSSSTGSFGTAIVLDNTNSTGVTVNGTWVFSTSTAGYYGNGYLHDNNTGGAGGKSVRYSPTLTTGGKYAIFINWTSGANRAANTPVDVIYNGLTNTYQINQQFNGGQWVWLGNFNFKAGNSGAVQIRNDGANGYVIADAVKFALLVPQPVAPTQLSARAGNKLVQLTWSMVPSASSYKIMRGLNSNGPFTLIGTATLGGYTDFTVANGTTYHYVISAINSGGESDYTGSVSATPNCGSVIPTGLTPQASPASNQISLRWNTPSIAAASQIAYYNLKRSAAGSGPFTTITNTTDTSYLDNNVTPGTVYYYVVSAVNPCGVEGQNSKVVAATPGIVVDNTDSSNVVISGSWTTNTNPGDFGVNYLHDGNTGAGKSVRYSPSLPLAGSYDVYLWWVASGNRATNSPMDIIHASGTNTIYVDQTQSGALWKHVGSFTFNAGNTGYIKIRNDGASGYVVADAVQLVWNTNQVTMEPSSQAQPTNLSSASLSLSASPTANTLIMSWATEAAGYRLQSAESLSAPVNWTTILTVTNGQNSQVLPMTNTMMFYRLSPP